jgi:hypothetical protein
VVKPARFGWNGLGFFLCVVLAGDLAISWMWWHAGVDLIVIVMRGIGVAVVVGVLLAIARPWSRRPY